MRNVARAAASFVVIGAMAAGCSSSYKGLSKADFVTQANAICTQANQDTEAYAKELPKNPTPAVVAKVEKKAIPVLNHELDEIGALKPPKADRARVKAILDEARAEAKTFATQLDADPKAALSGPDPLKKSEDDAKAYGLTVCGSSST